MTLVGLALTSLWASACLYEWDGYDPREANQCIAGATRVCYTGPAGTQDVGVCRSGNQSCEMGRWGACQGEVLPSDEVCSTPEDEDCDGQVVDPEDACSCELGAVFACYPGPANTEGVGLCRGGVRLCAEGEDFNVPGPCVGAVLPAHESCSTADDDDCDGVTNDHCANWNLRIQGNSTSNSFDIINGTGNTLLLAGDHNSNISFGITTMTNTSIDGFAARLTATGQEVWVSEIDGAGTERANGIIEDSNGDVIVVGHFNNTLDVPGFAPITGNSTSSTDVFAVKLDGTTGTALWVYTAIGSNYDSALDVAVDDNDDVWVVGYYSSSIDFGDGSVGASSRNGFILKLAAADGTLIQKDVFGGSGNDEARGVVVDPGEGVYVVGKHASSVTIGGGTLNNAGGEDGFMVKLDLDGNHIWNRVMSGPGGSATNKLAIGPDHSIAVVGNFTASVDLGDGAVGGTNGNSIFVADYTSSGLYRWGEGYGDGDPQVSHTVDVGDDGTVYMGGSMRGSLVFDDETVRAAAADEDDDMILLVHDAEGNPLWARRFGTQQDQDVRGLVITPGGELIITGDCSDNLDFGLGTLPGDPDKDDICLVSLSP